MSSILHSLFLLIMPSLRSFNDLVHLEHRVDQWVEVTAPDDKNFCFLVPDLNGLEIMREVKSCLDSVQLYCLCCRIIHIKLLWVLLHYIDVQWSNLRYVKGFNNFERFRYFHLFWQTMNGSAMSSSSCIASAIIYMLDHWFVWSLFLTGRAFKDQYIKDLFDWPMQVLHGLSRFAIGTHPFILRTGDVIRHAIMAEGAVTDRTLLWLHHD